MRLVSKVFTLALVLTSWAGLVGTCDASAAGEAQVAAELRAMKARLDGLETRLARQEDIEKIRVLAFSYGDYMDNALYDQVLDMFSPNIESCEVSGYGVFKGLDGCKRFWHIGMGNMYGGNTNQLAFGVMAKHYLLKDVISVAADGKTAHGRFDYIGYGGHFGKPESVNQQMGVYTFDFVKEDGVWKFGKFQVTFDAVNFNYRDWVTNPIIRCPKMEAKPDAPLTFFHPFPETGVTAFRDPNPVTGKPIPVGVTSTHYWQGNWPGEFGGPCGKREGAVAVTP